jgi:hypothetical protein
VALARNPLLVFATAHRSIPRAVWHTIGAILTALLAYAIWRAYQSPDFLLELGALKLC